MYKHALVLVSDETDGRFLLQGVARDFYALGTKITVAHFTADYRELDIAGDSMTKDRQSTEIIDAKDMLSNLEEYASFPVGIKEMVTLYRFKDVKNYISTAGIDLVIMGHRNHFLGMYSSHSAAFINHLVVDVLIKNINVH